MIYSIIQKSQLEGAHRLDAEYYQPEYLNLSAKLADAKTIQEATTTCDLQSNGAFKQIFNILNDGKEKIVPYIRSENVGDFFINLNDLAHISKEAHEKLKKTQTKLNDILMARKGKIGGATLVTQEAIDFNSNDNIVNIRIKEPQKIDPVYFITFFNSDFGLKQIERMATGNVQPWLSMYQLRNLKIKILSKPLQEEIKKNVMEAYQELNNSKLFYQQAENLLSEELGLNDFQVKDDLSFVVNLSDTKSANRVDAEYFRPKYDQILNQISKHKTTTLNSSFHIIRGKNFEYKEDGEIGVIKTKQLNQKEISFETESQTSQEIVNKEKLPLIENSDVLFASMGVGSLGKTNICYDFDSLGKKYTTDSTLRIFRKQNKGEVLPEALVIFLNSVLGQEIIYKYIVGTSGIISIYEDDLKNLLIPVLPEETQQKIADLVRRSHEARKKSKELLEEAKRKVEEMIEKDGKTNG